MTILTDDEISRVLAQARQYGKPEDRTKWVALMTVLSNYGCRVSEALSLRWDQVDFGHGTITFPTLKRKKAMTRTLPLLPAVASVLQAHAASRNGDRRVFPMTAYGRCVAWRGFQTMLRRAGIPPIKLHALRHSCASRLVQQDLAMARDVLGHASVATTDKYIHAIRLREKFTAIGAI